LLIGTAIGTWALLSFGHDILKRVLGILVSGWALFMLLRGEGTAAPETAVQYARQMTYAAPLSGLLGGALGAMFSVNGPPIIIYLSYILEDKQVFRATLYGIFFADACYKMVLFSVNGLLNSEVFRFALLMAPFLIAGTAAGSWLQEYINQQAFKKVVALILVVTGVILLI
jgi:uncharacterized membrane protein YfcA